MLDTSLSFRMAACAALLALAAPAVAVVSPSIEVHAIVERDDGKLAELQVADGGVLRSGDRLQVRVRAPQDGYIYVIAYGSSGSALLLHPFSGRTETARVRAGEVKVVPGEGVYLPLDTRPGREVVFAVWAEAPLKSVSSLLVRMEGAAGDADRAEQILREVHPEARRVAFRHLDRKPLYGVDLVSTGMVMQYQATGTIAPLSERPITPTMRANPYTIVSPVEVPTDNSVLDAVPVVARDPVLQPSGGQAGSAEPSLDALLAEPVVEEQVLGGVGSRLRAFESGAASPAPRPATAVEPAPEPAPPVQPQVIGPGAPRQPPADPESPLSGSTPDKSSALSPAAPSVNTGLTGAISALFGAGASAPPDPVEGVPTPVRAAATEQPSAGTDARVLPLQPGTTPAAAPSPMLELELSADARAGREKTAPAPVPGAGDVASGAMTVAAPAAASTDASAIPPAARVSSVVSLSDNTQAPDPAELGLDIRRGSTAVSRADAVPTPSGSGDVATRSSASAATSAAAPGRGQPGVATAPLPARDEGGGGLSGGLASLFGSTANPSVTERASTPSTRPSDSSASVTRAGTQPPASAPSADVAPVPAPARVAIAPAAPRESTASGDGVVGLSMEQPGAKQDNQQPVPDAPADAGTDTGLFGAIGSWLAPSLSPARPGGKRGDGAVTVEAPGKPAAGVTAARDTAGGSAAGTGAGSTPPVSTTPHGSADATAASAVTSSSVTPTAASSRTPDGRADRPPEIVATPAAARPLAADSSAESGRQQAAPAAESAGVFAALGSLFASSPAAQGSPAGTATTGSSPGARVEPAVAASPDAPAPAAAVGSSAPADEPTRVDTQTTVASPKTGDDKPGLFSSLGGLLGFGAGNAAANAGATERPQPTLPTIEATAAPTQPPRPAINLQEGVVVRLDGPQTRQGAGSTAAGVVLADEGSRIRALLGETPQPESTAPATVAATTGPASGTAAAPAAPAPPAPVPTVAAAGPVPAPAPLPASAPTLTASVAAPAPAVVVAPPLPGLSPGGTAVVPAPQLATMSTAQSIDSARRLARGVVLVVTPAGSGSGVLVDAAGHVLTNWHLVGEYPAVTVLVKDAVGDLPARGQRIRATVVRYSKFADLALLKMERVPDSAAPLALGDASTLREGSMLHAIGHPDGGVWSHTPVIVTRVQEQGSWYSGQSFLHKAGVINGQAHTDPGADGAALIDAEQRLVALAAKATRRGDKVQAVSVGTIRDFLRSSGATASIASGG